MIKLPLEVILSVQSTVSAVVWIQLKPLVPAVVVGSMMTAEAKTPAFNGVGLSTTWIVVFVIVVLEAVVGAVIPTVGALASIRYPLSVFEFVSPSLSVAT